MIGVYICRDAEANVLYVGSAGDIDKRLCQHHGKAWWPLVANVERVETTTRALAFSVEREHIVRLNPIHNRRGKSGAKAVTRNLVGPVIAPRSDVFAELIEYHGTVAALAKVVAIDHMTMSNIWRGVTMPSSKVVARLMVVTGMSFDELFAVEIAGDVTDPAEWVEARPTRRKAVA